MTPIAANVLAEALRLPDDERAEIAARLLESLDSADGDAAAAWEAEIQKRLQEIQTGQVQAIPWPEARRLIAEDTEAPGEA